MRPSPRPRRGRNRRRSTRPFSQGTRGDAIPPAGCATLYADAKPCSSRSGRLSWRARVRGDTDERKTGRDRGGRRRAERAHRDCGAATGGERSELPRSRSQLGFHDGARLRRESCRHPRPKIPYMLIYNVGHDGAAEGRGVQRPRRPFRSKPRRISAATCSTCSRGDLLWWYNTETSAG